MQLGVFRIRGSRFYRDPDGALLPLWKMLESADEEPADGGPDSGKTENRKTHETEDAVPDSTDEQADEGSEPDTEPESELDQGASVPESEGVPSSTDEPVATDSQKTVVSASSVDDILSLSSRELGRVLCEILETLPNHSCKKDRLTYYVCKYFGVITVGGPVVE